MINSFSQGWGSRGGGGWRTVPTFRFQMRGSLQVRAWKIRGPSRDPAAGEGSALDHASSFAPQPGPGNGAAVWRAGGRGQHNPPFQLGRGRGPGGGRCGRRGQGVYEAQGVSCNPQPGTSPSSLQPFPPPTPSQPGLFVVLILAAASANPNHHGVGVMGWGLLHPLAYPLASFSKLLRA